MWAGMSRDKDSAALVRAWEMEYQLTPSLEEEKLCFRVRSEGFPPVIIFYI